MKSKFLFPAYFRIIGWMLAVPGFILGYLVLFRNFTIGFLTQQEGHKNEIFGVMLYSWTDELALILVILGLIFIAFSKEKKEDELVSRLRLDALYWSVLANYFVWLVFGHFTENIYIYNLFTPLLIFIVRFNYLIHFRKGTFIIPKANFLPYKFFRPAAVAVSISCVFTLVITGVFDVNIREWVSDLLYISLLASLLIWMYSGNKAEDELAMQYRLDSIYLAVLVNYGLLLILTLTVFGLGFLTVMAANFIFILIFFVLRFSYVSYIGGREDQPLKGGLLA